MEKGGQVFILHFRNKDARSKSEERGAWRKEQRGLGGDHIHSVGIMCSIFLKSGSPVITTASFSRAVAVAKQSAREMG